MLSDPLPGRLVGDRYEVGERIARGGMATVYRAHDRRLDRVVALKVMHPHLAESPDFVARFRREARAAARLSNPGVVAVYDQGSIDGVAYLVMELVDGPTLRDVIDSGPLTVEEALGLTAQVLRPLAAAHRAGLMHRDIKPENVLLPLDGSVAKVTDFGLARAVTEAQQTTTGNVLGTAAYLAPELITAGTATPRADVFATGIMLYELLTGSQPFTAPSPIRVAFRNVHEDVPAPSLLIPGLAPEVDRLVAALTRRTAALRPADGDSALAALRSAAARLTPSQRRLRRGGRADTARTQRALAANAAASRHAVLEAPEDGAGPGSAASASTTSALTPSAGLRTVSLPIGALAPGATTRLPAPPPPGATAALPVGAMAGAARQASSAPDAGRSSASAAQPPSKGEPTHSSRRAFLAAAGALVVAGAGGSAWYLLAGPGRRVRVPDIRGIAVERARARIEAQGLVWGATTQAYSDTVAAGDVISVSPSPSSSVRTGTTVTAVVSRGVEHRTVPTVAGLGKDAAEKAITSAGLTVGTVTESYSSTAASGTVISSSPSAGTSAVHGSKVAITVSLGRRPATVPDVVGLKKSEAKKAIEDAGLVVGTTTEAASDSVDKGKVVSSSPSAGASGHHEGDSVDLVVSSGPDKVKVPDVTGMDVDAATSELEDAGLAASVDSVLGGIFGQVAATSPKAGTKVPKGSTVTLRVV